MNPIESVTSRIVKLRDLLRLSQLEFAEQVGITQGALSQLESGKSRLSLDTIIKISQAFKVNCNWLINGSDRIFMSDAFDESAPQQEDETVPTMHGLIPLIREEAHAGYIQNHHDSEFISTLDVYKIPGYEAGDYRLFEIAGDSMVPTIYPREIVVSEFIEDRKSIENGTLCILITDDSIACKRVYFNPEDDYFVILKSDNADFKTYAVSLGEILQFWEVKAKITNVFSQEHTMDAKKISNMEMDIKELKDQISKLAPADREN